MLSALFTLLGTLLFCVVALSEQVKQKVGSDVTLMPSYFVNASNIIWKKANKKLVDVDLKGSRLNISYYGLVDRMSFGLTDGSLTIRNLTMEDSGNYIAVVTFGSPFKKTDIALTVLNCPDQPIISVESIEDQFVVSCKSFSPDITYEWFNQTRSVSKSRLYAEPKKDGTLTCVVDNGVCNKNSSINFYIPAQPKVILVGYNFILEPKYTGDPSEIIWKVDGDNLVEMVLKPQVDELFYRLQDRAIISRMDGSLIIRGLTMEDYGVYTAVVLVNNDYYYTEIRLESSHLSGWSIVLIVILTLAGINTIITLLLLLLLLLLLWYCCCRKPIRLSGENIILLVVVGILSLLILVLWYNYYKKSSDLSESFILIVFVVLFLIPFAINVVFLLWDCCSKKPSGLSRGDIILIIVDGILSPFAALITIFFLQYYYYKKSERCITVQFCNDVKNGNDKSQKLLEDDSKRIIILSVQLLDDGYFTTEAVMSNGKKRRFTEGRKIVFEVDGETQVKELVCKKDGVTMFEYAFSSLKLHASNIKLEPESVIVNNAQGKKLYKVFFWLEEPPKSKSITFHPIKMTGKDQITWKKDHQRLNTEGNSIKCKPNGDLTINNATSEDEGKYTIQCKDKKLDQEFILQLSGWEDST